MKGDPDSADLSHRLPNLLERGVKSIHCSGPATVKRLRRESRQIELS
jgi:hypothetical protein